MKKKEYKHKYLIKIAYRKTIARYPDQDVMEVPIRVFALCEKCADFKEFMI